MIKIRRWQIILPVLFTLFFVFSCAQNTIIRVKKPAEINTSGIHHLAIVDFRGPENSGVIASSAFTSELWKTNFYTLVERQELERILSEHALNMSGVVDVQTAVEAGELLGVDGIIVGEVSSYNCQDHVRHKKVKKQEWTGEYEKDKNGNYIYEKTLFGGKTKKKKYKDVWVNEEYINREASVGAVFRLVDVKTSEIRATRQTMKSFNKNYGESATPPAKEQILNELLRNGIGDFVNMLAPHEVAIKTQFAKGDNEVNKGIEFAKNNLWDKARETWLQCVQKNSGNHQAWYNLGLGYEVDGDFEQAEMALDKAVSIKSQKIYMNGLNRVRKEKQDSLKLEKQLEGR